jgi:hypothetical protein
MKVPKKKLEDKLNRLIDVYSSKIHLKSFAIEYFVNKNFNEERIISILNKDIPIRGVSEIELYYLTRIFTLAKSPRTNEFVVSENDREKLKSEDYFTDLEIEKADEYRLERKIKNEDHVIISNVQLTQPGCYLVVMSYDELVNLWTDGWIKYDFKTQREASFKIHKGTIIKSPTIYDEAVASIRDIISIDDYKFKPNLITLNIPDNGLSSFNYNPKTKELRIDKGTKLPVIDGFHRVLGTVRAKEQNPKIKGIWYVSIHNESTEEAQNYIEREARTNPISETHLSSFKTDDSSVQIATKLNTNGNDKINSMFKKLATDVVEISHGDKYTLFETVIISLNHTFNDKTLNSKILKPLDITLIAKYLIEGFNWITGSLKQFENPRENNDVSTHPNMFAFYIVLLYDLYEYYENKNEWEDKIMNKILSIDFSSNNTIWKKLGILDNKINKSSITKMKKYLLEERKLVSVDGK